MRGRIEPGSTIQATLMVEGYGGPEAELIVWEHTDDRIWAAWASRHHRDFGEDEGPKPSSHHFELRFCRIVDGGELWSDPDMDGWVLIRTPDGAPVVLGRYVARDPANAAEQVAEIARRDVAARPLRPARQRENSSG